MGNRLQFIPLICFILFPITFITTYTIALAHDHINAFYSTISDTGALPPESCWFALLLFFTGLALGSTVYVRYKQIESHFPGDALQMQKLNKVALWIGVISALGILLVGAFQQTNAMVMHLVGASLCFFSGSVYLIIQAHFTFRMLPTYAHIWIARGRLIVGVSCTFILVVSLVTGSLSFIGFEGKNPMKWDRNEPNWNLRAVSVVCEWTGVALLDIYILTFVLDFRKLCFKRPQVKESLL